MKKYLPRIYDYFLAINLEATGAVLVEGAKWCGKTTTCEQAAGSVVYLQDPATRDQNIRLARLAPKVLLEGATPRLVDEWQLAPALWDALGYDVNLVPFRPAIRLLQESLVGLSASCHPPFLDYIITHINTY